MYDTERRLAISATTEACRLGREVQSEIVAASDAQTKGDRSPVTIADLAIQVVVSHLLCARFPEDPLLAEEDMEALSAPGADDLADRVLALCRRYIPDITEAGMLDSLSRADHPGGNDGRYWVLDPVDGTKGFLRGEQYAIALALVDRGRVVVGALGCPNLPLHGRSSTSPAGCIFTAVRGGGAGVRAMGSDEESPIRVDGIADPAQAVFCESVEAAHAAHSVQAAIAGRLDITAPPYRIDSQCKYGIVARGDASIYLRLPSAKGYREKVWDHAAGSLVIEEAGGRVSDLEGRPLDLTTGRYITNQNGIVATNGHVHEKVLAAARAVLADREC